MPERDVVRMENRTTRREFLSASLALPGLFLFHAAGAFAAQPGALEPTPACGDADETTIAQTAGPFYKPSSPARKSLIEPGIRGTRIVVDGIVRSTRCQPIEGALLDFWHADTNGAYDNIGYKLRGHQVTDRAGRYHLETIVPGLYSGRTRHFHVRVQAPNRTMLTTQLYFPGEPANRSDWIFNRKLLLSIREGAGGKTAAFDFVLNLG
jgi:protocatechuate 3,4-dioxygenase beta subunit